ncbi:GntR family transcriptional regulator [Lichenicoccus sp.]|uniref:GntR family transcriptional regulator n=1 Tax=Lichenicoccus sp. TaxID=2781899 RepID=UPI003D118256
MTGLGPRQGHQYSMLAATAALNRMQVRTLGDRIHDLMRDRILSGNLVGGEPIRQDTIAAELGISKIPLREALTRLEQNGLVSSHANRGYVVSLLSAEEAEEVFALRLKLEPDAVVRGSRHAVSADHKMAEAALLELEARIRAGSLEQGTYNRLFHMTLIQPRAGRLTVSLIERLNIIADRYVRLHLKPDGRKSRANAEHREILACWIGRDLRRLDALVQSHIRNTLNDLRRQLG